MTLDQARWMAGKAANLSGWRGKATNLTERRSPETSGEPTRRARRHRRSSPSGVPAGAGGSGRDASSVRTRAHTGMVRITVRVRPGSARPGVGGEHGGALVVRVRERAVDGQATAAALAAVAAAFGVRRPAVTLIAGASNRTKIVDVAGADPAALARLMAT